MWQPDGFRYSADSFWLAGFALEHATGHSALDLGTGSGILAMLLARHGWDSRGIDVGHHWQPGWARTQADSTSSVELTVRDVRDEAGSADLIVCNPPYFPAGTGPVSPDPLKALARTESTATLHDFVEAAARCLLPEGLAAFVVPTSRVSELEHSALVPRLRTHVGRKRTLVGLRHEPGPCVERSLTRTEAQSFYERALSEPSPLGPAEPS